MLEVNYERRIMIYAFEWFWKWEASSKNNEKTVPILGGCGWVRIFYIITLITAAGDALGVGKEL